MNCCRFGLPSQRTHIACPSVTLKCDGWLVSLLVTGSVCPRPMECPHCYKQVKAQSKSCPACGGYIPPGQHLLEQAGLDQSEAPNTTASVATGRSGCHSPRLATLGARFNAFVLDTIVLFGIFAAADAWVLMRWSSFDKAELSLSTASLLATIGINALIFFLYTWIFEASCGATLGKVIVGIRVVRTGRRSALAAAAIRNLLRTCGRTGLVRSWRNRGGLFAMETTTRRSFRRDHRRGT